MTGIVSPPEFELFGPEDVESIDWADPVSDDPFNDDLELWMLAGQGIPGGFGGDQWVDLTRKHIGTLTNMDPATDWKGTSRPGGFGELDFDGSDDRVACGASPTRSGGDMTVSFALYLRTSTSEDRIFSALDTSGAFEGWGVRVTSGDAKDLDFLDGTGWRSTTTSWLTTGGWHYVTITSQGTSIKFYNNGTHVQTLTGVAIQSNTADLTIGNHPSSSIAIDGQLDDIRIYNRALTANEVSGLYHQSKESYPDTLNRYTTSRYRVAAAGGGTVPRMALLGVG